MCTTRSWAQILSSHNVSVIMRVAMSGATPLFVRLALLASVVLPDASNASFGAFVCCSLHPLAASVRPAVLFRLPDACPDCVPSETEYRPYRPSVTPISDLVFLGTDFHLFFLLHRCRVVACRDA